MLQRRLTQASLNSNIKQGLQPDLTSTFFRIATTSKQKVIRTVAMTITLLAASCTAYLPDLSNETQKTERDSARVPKIDLSQARWQKLTPTQPEQNPVRMAILERDQKIGATRIAIKAPPNTTIPPHWFTVQGACTVVDGTFVFDGVDANGRPERIRRRPGDFLMLPPNYILKMSTEGSTDAILYLTLYGEWSPQFQANAWGNKTTGPAKPALRGAN